MDLARFMRKSRHVSSVLLPLPAQRRGNGGVLHGRSVNASLIKCPPSERSYSSCLHFPSALFSFFPAIFHKVYFYVIFFLFLLLKYFVCVCVLPAVRRHRSLYLKFTPPRHSNTQTRTHIHTHTITYASA